MRTVMQEVESIFFRGSRALLLSNRVRGFANLHTHKSVPVKRLVKSVTLSDQDKSRSLTATIEG